MLCLVADGQQSSCPPGPFTTMTVIDTSYTETCTDCNCGALECGGGLAALSSDGLCDVANTPDGGTATPDAGIFDGGSVGNTYPVPEPCAPANVAQAGGQGELWGMLLTPPTPAEASCAPSGGVPSGKATATMPKTICCM
jgi:hypothetical protein